MAEVGSNVSRTYLYYGSKEGNDASVMIDSKTVVEKKEYVATGVLTYALGDIIEIEIPQFSVFNLGDKIKITVYSKTGIFVFESTVVAKDNGSLIILNPPENRRKFIEKREYARVDVNHTGYLHRMQDNAKRREQRFEAPIDFMINNISMSGIGFTLNYDLHLNHQSQLEVELDLGFKLTCVAEIVRAESKQTGIYYGVRYLDLPKEQSNPLRGFILRNQVETYFVQKKEEKHRQAILERNPVLNE
ncbi:PilZ domain protein [compost metagenome]